MNKFHNSTLVILMLLVGCQKSSEIREIERELDLMIPKIGVEYTPPLWNSLYDKIYSLTNDEMRLVCHKYVFERLHSIRFGLGNYKRQTSLLREIHLHSSLRPSGKMKWGISLEEAFVYHLRHLGWMRDQLEILKPTHIINRSKLSAVENKEWEQWRDSYLYCKDFYEMQLGMFEKHYARDFKDCNVSTEDRIRIEKQITDFLGRPIRNAQQVDANYKAACQSPEVMSIWRGEVGPACFARDIDPPVMFPALEVSE